MLSMQSSSFGEEFGNTQVLLRNAEQRTNNVLVDDKLSAIWSSLEQVTGEEKAVCLGQLASSRTKSFINMRIVPSRRCENWPEVAQLLYAGTLAEQNCEDCQVLHQRVKGLCLDLQGRNCFLKSVSTRSLLCAFRWSWSLSCVEIVLTHLSNKHFDTKVFTCHVQR